MCPSQSGPPRCLGLLGGIALQEPARSKQNTPPRDFLRSKALSRGLGMRRAGSLWHKKASVAIPRHRGGPVCSTHLTVEK